ncbi:MAG: hypothetical protein AAGA18_10790 [Verrucomicrobiota bacterium]
MNKETVSLVIGCFILGVGLGYLALPLKMSQKTPSVKPAQSPDGLGTYNGDRPPTKTVADAKKTADPPTLQQLQAWSFDSGLWQIQEAATLLLTESPEAAKQTALSSLPLNEASTEFRTSIFRAMLEKDPSEVGALVAGIEQLPPLQAEQGRHALLNALSQVDPSYALDYLNHTKHYDNLSAVANIFNRLAHQNAQEAIKLIDELGPLATRMEAAKALLPHLIESGVPDLQSITNLFADPSISYSLTQEALRTLALDNPKRAAELALSEKHMTRRRQYLAGVASSWVDDDPDAFFSFIDSVDNEQTRKMLHSIGVQHLARYDVERTTKLIASTSNPQEKMAIINRVAHIMAVEDPQATINWLEGFPEEMQQAALPGILSQLAVVDPELARNYIDTQVADNKLASAIGSVINSMAIENPQAALDYARTLHSPDLIQSSINQAYQIWAKNDFEAAYEAALEETSPETSRQALEVVTDVWVYQDPRDYVEWASQLEGEGSSRFYRKGIATLAQLDANEAAEHFTRIVSRHEEAGGNVNQYIGLATEIAGTLPSPEEAISWSQQHESEEMRQAALRQASAQWAVQDPQRLISKLQEMDPSVATTVRVSAAREMARGNPLSAFEVAAGITDSEQRLDTLAYAYAYALDINDTQADKALANVSNIKPDEISVIMDLSQKYQ